MAHVLLDTRFPAEQQAYLEEQCESVIIMDETDMEKLNPESINCVLSYGHTKIDAAFLDRFRLRGVRVVSNFGTGYDHIDVESIMQRGVPVGHTPGFVLRDTTADLAIGLCISAARNFQEAVERSRKGVHDSNWLSKDFSNCTMGIV